jgi:integrase
MPEKRVTVWVQRFKDRAHLMLQWIDPDTGKRKSKSAETADEKQAETARADLESDLNHGRHQEASRMSWERFRELFEEEFVAVRRKNTRANYEDTLDAFERLCRPTTLRGVNERTVSAFVAALLRQPGRGAGETMAPSTVKVRLQFLRTALRWAAGQKLIPAAPEFPKVKVPRKRPQPVPAESFEKLLDKAPDDAMRAVVLCGWLAGLRLEETWALEWEESDAAPWVDFARDRIILPAELVKGDEDQAVPLDALLRAALECLPRQGRRVFRFVALGGGELPAAGLGKRVIALARRAGVRLSMRILRRGFACAYASDVPAQVLQTLMRHKHISTTMAYYANTEAAAVEAVRRRNSQRNIANAAGGCKGATADGARAND